MKRIIPLILILFLITACSPNLNKTYSIIRLLEKKHKLVNNLVNIKGQISYNCADCSQKYIILTNDINAPAKMQLKLAINLNQQNNVEQFSNLKTGDQIIINAKFLEKNSNECGISNEHGCFIFNQLITNNTTRQ